MMRTAFLLWCVLASAPRSICLGQVPPAEEQRSFTHLSVEDGLSQSSVISIAQDSTGFMWFGTRNCLNRYDSRTFKVYRHRAGDSSSISSNDYIFALLKDSRNRLWIGTQRGLDLYKPDGDAFEQFYHDTLRSGTLSDTYINCLYEDREGRIWIGTNNGLNLLIQDHPCRFTSYGQATVPAAGLPSGEIHAICEGRSGALWIGTAAGLTKMAIIGGRPVFLTYQHHPGDTGSLSCNSVTSIAIDRNGRLWVGTECGGLNAFDPERRTFVHYAHDPSQPHSISSNNIRKIIVDPDDNLWIGTIDGLNHFNQQQQSFTIYRYDPENPQSLSNNSIRDLYEDKYGSLWVGTVFGGVNVTHAIATPFTVYKTSSLVNSISSNVVSAITADEKHNLWIGTEAEGVNYYDRQKDRFIHYKHDPANPASISGNFIKCIYRDKDNRVWIGTYDGGLNLFDPGTGAFTHYKHDPANPQSLPGDNISCIFQDSRDRFWVGAYGKGLNLFDRQHGSFKTYTTDPSSAYRISSNRIRVLYEDRGKNLWIGTAHGLNRLPAGSDHFTWFLKNADKKDSLNYIKSGKNRYAYKLDGFEKDWNYVDNPSATYTNLPPGKYIFLVKATNNDQLWNDSPSKMQIVVLPPLWATWWAYTLYVLLIGITLFLVIRFFRRQARLERDLYYEHQQKLQQQELHQLKIDFFTNISHEIRTPLALILGPIEKLMQLAKGHEVVDRQLGLAKKNADRLVRLVTELLDFRKAESGHMKLWVTQGNLVVFVREVFSNFEELAASRHMFYRFETRNTYSIPASSLMA